MIALITACAGLAALLLAARARPPDSVTAAGLTPMMNHARVRMTGRAEAPPRFSTGGDGTAAFAGFVLNDGTGRVRVGARDAAARHLQDLRPALSAGTLVEVTGSLSMSAGRLPSLYVDDARAIAVLVRGGPGTPPAGRKRGAR